MVVEHQTDAGRLHLAGLRAAIQGYELRDGILAAMLFERRHPRPQELAPLDLGELFTDATPHARWEAQVDSKALLDDAKAYGQKLLTRKATAPELVTAMAADHPGFTTKSYGDVLFFGVQGQ